MLAGSSRVCLGIVGASLGPADDLIEKEELGTLREKYLGILRRTHVNLVVYYLGKRLCAEMERGYDGERHGFTRLHPKQVDSYSPRSIE